MQSHDWRAEAERQVRRTSDELFEAHRGAYTLFAPDVLVVFGNRGDEEVLVLKGRLAQHGITVLGHAVREEGLCWAMVVRSAMGPDRLTDLVWDCWRDVDPHDPSVAIQQHIAREATDASKPGPPNMN